MFIPHGICITTECQIELLYQFGKSMGIIFQIFPNIFQICSILLLSFQNSPCIYIRHLILFHMSYIYSFVFCSTFCFSVSVQIFSVFIYPFMHPLFFMIYFAKKFFSHKIIESPCYPVFLYYLSLLIFINLYYFRDLIYSLPFLYHFNVYLLSLLIVNG